MLYEKIAFFYSTRRACGYTVTDLRNGFFIYSWLYCCRPGKTVFIKMVTGNIYYVNRIRFDTYADACNYCIAAGWIIIHVELISYGYCRLITRPATVADMSQKPKHI